MGIPWYEANTYGRILEIMVDACFLPHTYQMWLRGATDIMARAKINGDCPVRVWIDPRSFEAWCRANDYTTDAEARVEFAHVKAQAWAQETDT
jgi:hypothetical protein